MQLFLAPALATFCAVSAACAPGTTAPAPPVARARPPAEPATTAQAPAPTEDCANGSWVEQPSGSGSYRYCMVAGREHGPFESTWDEGAPRARGGFRDGRAEGAWTFWHPNGQVMARGEMRADLPHGTWRYFTEDGEPATPGVVCVIDRKSRTAVPRVYVRLSPRRGDGGRNAPTGSTDADGRVELGMLAPGPYRAAVLGSTRVFDALLMVRAGAAVQVLEVDLPAPLPGAPPATACTERRFRLLPF